MRRNLLIGIDLLAFIPTFGERGAGEVRGRALASQRILLLQEGLSLLLHAKGLLVRDTTSAGHVRQGVGHITTFVKVPRRGLRLSVE